MHTLIRIILISIALSYGLSYLKANVLPQTGHAVTSVERYNAERPLKEQV